MKNIFFMGRKNYNYATTKLKLYIRCLSEWNCCTIDLYHAKAMLVGKKRFCQASPYTQEDRIEYEWAKTKM
jgi:hypothetical protein